MDSLSQAAFGSVVGLLVCRGQQPRRAILYGAALATLPDLDVVVRYDNDLLNTIQHRTWSHAWPVQVALAPLLALGVQRLTDYRYLTCFFFCLLILTTHTLLDALTVYSTALYWPLSRETVMGGSIFIIDPLFTLPLLVAIVLIWRYRPRPKAAAPRRRAVLGLAAGGLLLSSAYVGWGLYAQALIGTRAAQTLDAQNIAYQRLVVTPTPFNSLLWRVVAVGQQHYYEGFYGFLDSSDVIDLRAYARNLSLLPRLPTQTAWQQLDAFSHGFSALDLAGDNIIAKDLRMGIEPVYFFRFQLAQLDATGNAALLPPDFAPEPPFDPRFFMWIGRRLFDENIETLSEYLF